MDITECRERTVAWVNTSSPIMENVTPPPSHPGYTPENGHALRDRHTPSDGNTPRERMTAVKGRTSPEISETTVDHVNTQRRIYPNRRVWGPERSTPAQHAPGYYPPSGLVTRSRLYSSVPLETFNASNRQLVATLAKQNLPKCHPDVFKGDATMFHSWKRSLKAMIRDADIAPEQELDLLRSFTRGNP